MKNNIMQQVEEEFGQPFLDVVLGFAGEGESINATAFLLGYASPTPFKRWVNRHGLKHKFKTGEECAGRISFRANTGSTPARLAAVKLASAANPTYKHVEVGGITDTLAGHARRVGISARTVYSRIYAGRSVEEALKKTCYRRQPSTKNHIWRKKIDDRLRPAPKSM